MQHDEPSRRQLFTTAMGGLFAWFGLRRAQAIEPTPKAIPVLPTNPESLVTTYCYVAVEEPEFVRFCNSYDAHGRIISQTFIAGDRGTPIIPPLD